MQPAAALEEERLAVRAPESAGAGLTIGILRQLNGLTTAVTRSRPDVVDAAIVIGPLDVLPVRCPLMTARMLYANEVIDGELCGAGRLRVRPGSTDPHRGCASGKPA